MKHFRTMNLAAARLLVVLFAISETISAFGVCDAPSYLGGVKWTDDASHVSITISIRLASISTLPR